MSPQALVNLFWRWYRHVGFDGCSSHSGRRTFITNAARKISTVGGSLRDVQMLAGHSNLRTTQAYIEANAEAQVRIVDLRLASPGYFRLLASNCLSEAFADSSPAAAAISYHLRACARSLGTPKPF